MGETSEIPSEIPSRSLGTSRDGEWGKSSRDARLIPAAIPELFLTHPSPCPAPGVPGALQGAIRGYRGWAYRGYRGWAYRGRAYRGYRSWAYRGWAYQVRAGSVPALRVLGILGRGKRPPSDPHGVTPPLPPQPPVLPCPCPFHGPEGRTGPRGVAAPLTAPGSH